MTKKSKIWWIFSFCCACSIAASPTPTALGQAQEEQPQLEDLQNVAAEFLVRVDVDKPSRVYREGDVLKITASSGRDGFLYAFYQQADKSILQIFPNSIQTDNRVRARQTIQLPAAGDRFTWVVGPPFGEEKIKILVSSERLKAGEATALGNELFAPIDSEGLKGMQVELLAAAPSTWAEHGVSLTTRPAESPLDEPRPKRYGVFFGVSHHEFNAEHEADTDGQHSWNMATCHRDANQLAELLKSEGRLDEIRVLTNESATKVKIAEAINNWLPKVSVPGDEVFIYFSGHGGKIADEGSDEPDGEDEFLIPHDFADGGVLNVLENQYKEGKLDERQIYQLGRIRRLAGYDDRSGHRPSAQDAAYTLKRSTAITDDEFGYWLRRSLGGRRITVILDICKAGGFADAEKGELDNHKTDRFDFLDNELVRLKDIGEHNTVLLASSSAHINSQIRRDSFPANRGPLSVMTSFLIDILVNSPGRVSVEDAFHHCDDGMRVFFSGKPPEKKHKPYLFGNPGISTLLKP